MSLNRALSVVAVSAFGVFGLGAFEAANAVTYNVNMTLDDSYYVYDQQTYVPGQVRVSGRIETDGTMGSITTSNIMGWAFRITDGSRMQDISSASVNPYGGVSTFVSGLWADATSLMSTGIWDFYDHTITRDYNGRFRRVVDAQNVDRVLGTYYTTGGRLGFNGEERVSGAVQLGTVATVPLPAGFGLLAAGLGFLVLGGWRRRRARAMA